MRISSDAVIGTPPFCADIAWLSTLTRSVGAVSESDSIVPAPSPHVSAQKPGLAERSTPHDAALRVWHDATQATATGAVVLGDKEDPDTYAIFNEGCVVDLGEVGTGRSGGDVCCELKAWTDFMMVNRQPPTACAFAGSTHAFGNSEQPAFRIVHGVAARAGEHTWDPWRGVGSVTVDKKDDVYRDARRKGNTVYLLLHNLFGGFAPGAKTRLKMLGRRKTDRTVYESWAAPSFAEHWAQRISAALAIADAMTRSDASAACRASGSAPPTRSARAARERNAWGV